MRDLRAMLRIVDAPDDADDPEPLPRSVLTELSRLVGADAIYFMRLDVDRRKLPLYQEYGQLGAAEGLDEVFWANYWQAPGCSYPDRTGDLTSVTKLSDFSTMPGLRRTRMWSDYFRAFGVYREMMLCLPSPARRTLRLLLVRGPGSDFSERDRAILTLLRPHLDALFRKRQQATLTIRQRELLELVAAGRTNAQIARRLSISEGTVRTHMEHIFQRLNVTSRAAAVVRAFPHH